MLKYREAVKLIRDAGYAGHIEPSEDDEDLCLRNGAGVWRVPLNRKAVRAFVVDWSKPRPPHVTLH